MIDLEFFSWAIALAGSVVSLIFLLMLLRSNQDVDVTCATARHVKARA